MRQDERAPFDRALHRARRAAYPPGQFVGQESFMLADEVLAVAAAAGVGPGTRVLDVCCGVGGPGLHVVRSTGCRYVGVDASASAVRVAEGRAAGLGCRFEVARVPPLPSGRFDVVLLLETLLAFADKPALLRAVADALAPGGRFATTVEAGAPLTEAERALMPDADTVHLVPERELVAHLAGAGLRVRWRADVTDRHLAAARALGEAYAADADAISGLVGRRALEELLAAHRLWVAWLGQGRVRKVAVVAERSADDAVTAG